MMQEKLRLAGAPSCYNLYQICTRLMLSEPSVFALQQAAVRCKRNQDDSSSRVTGEIEALPLYAERRGTPEQRNAWK